MYLSSLREPFGNVLNIEQQSSYLIQKEKEKYGVRLSSGVALPHQSIPSSTLHPCDAAGDQQDGISLGVLCCYSRGLDSPTASIERSCLLQEGHSIELGTELAQHLYTSSTSTVHSAC